MINISFMLTQGQALATSIKTKKKRQGRGSSEQDIGSNTLLGKKTLWKCSAKSQNKFMTEQVNNHKNSLGKYK